MQPCYKRKSQTHWDKQINIITDLIAIIISCLNNNIFLKNIRSTGSIRVDIDNGISSHITKRKNGNVCNVFGNDISEDCNVFTTKQLAGMIMLDVVT